MNKLIRHEILALTYPFLKVAGNIHAPWTHKHLKEADARYLIDHVLEPGDILASKTYGEFTNILIPGDISHIAVYVGGGPGKDIVEAVDPKVQYIGIYDFVLTKDFIVVLRAKTPRARYAAGFAVNMVGSPYDYQFLITETRKMNKMFYCAEVGYVAHKMAYPEWEFKPRKIWDVPTMVPDDYILAERYFDLKWDSRNKIYK